MTVGSLRDQVIYPHLKDEMVGRGVHDEYLLNILKKVCGACMYRVVVDIVSHFGVIVILFQ